MSETENINKIIESYNDIIKSNMATEQDWLAYNNFTPEQKVQYIEQHKEAIEALKVTSTNKKQEQVKEQAKLYEIQPATKVSESHIWTLMSNYYHANGVNSWAGYQVPYFITSNAVMGKTYANLLNNFIKDYTNKNEIADNEKIYIVELGSGSGKFAFNMLKEIVRLMESYPILNKICYVMTDFTENNINFWVKNKAFKQFLDLEILDFAMFNIYRDDQILLKNSGIILSSENQQPHPLIIVANYLFDTMSVDVFRIQNNILQEGHVSVLSKQEETDPNNPSILTRMVNQYSYKPKYERGKNLSKYVKYYGLIVENPDVPYDQQVPIYRGAEKYDRILDYYYNYFSNNDAKSLLGGTVIFPITVLNCLDKLGRLSNYKLTILSGDKGSSDISTFEGLKDPFIAQHGSISMMANYHAVGLWFAIHGGVFYHNQYCDGSLRISCFTCNSSEVDYSNLTNLNNHNKEIQADYPNFTDYYNDHINLFSPPDYYSVYTYISNMVRKDDSVMTFDMVLSLIKMSNYDTDAFFNFKDFITKKINDSPIQYIQDFYKIMKKLWDNYYPLNKDRDLPFEFGSLMFKLKRYKKSIDFYEQSRIINGDTAIVLFNIALCYKELGMLDNSAMYAKQSVELDPNYDRSKILLQLVENDENNEEILDFV